VRRRKFIALLGDDVKKHFNGEVLIAKDLKGVLTGSNRCAAALSHSRLNRTSG
jgi:hypothetical protein